MSDVPAVVMSKVKDLAKNGEFDITKVGSHSGYDVYYLNPKKLAFIGYPMMVLEKNGSARIVTADTKEGLEFWKAVRDNIE